MPIFNNQTFARQGITVDGNEFSDCTFNECDITSMGERSGLRAIMRLTGVTGYSAALLIGRLNSCGL